MPALDQYLTDDQQGQPQASPEPPPRSSVPPIAALYGGAGGGAGYDPYQGAMTMALANRGGTDEASDQLLKYSREMYEANGSPLQQFNELRQKRDQAAQQKMQAIDRAMELLNTVQRGQTTNLPLLAASSAMLRPTRTGSFGESIGNAGSAAVPEVERQRERELRLANEQGKLGILQGDTAQTQAEQEMRDYLSQLGVADRAAVSAALAGSRRDVAGINAGARIGAAQIRAGSMVDAANIRANAHAVRYLGPRPDNPNVGVYLNTTDGSTFYGDAALGKGVGQAEPAKIREARVLQQEFAKPENGGQQLSFPDAYGMARSGVNNQHQWISEVQGAQRIIAQQHPELPIDTVTDMAREQVIKLHQQQPQQTPSGRPAQPGAAPAPSAVPARPAGPNGAAPAPGKQGRVLEYPPTPEGAQKALAALIQKGMAPDQAKAAVRNFAQQNNIKLPDDF